MRKILCIIVLFAFTVCSYSQIFGEKNVNGGKSYDYSYFCTPINSASVTCTVNVTNGKSLIPVFLLAKNGNSVLLDITWDNIQGTGVVSVKNPESGTTTFVVNITQQKEDITTTVSENITRNKNISGYNIVVTNTTISNNASVVITAEKVIKITPNTTIQNGTNVHLFIAGSSTYSVKEETGIEDIVNEVETEGETKLSQNVPNPFSGQTTISCYVPETSNNSYINIYNAMGNLENIIFLENPGHNDVIIESSVFKPGIYFYSLIVDNQLVESKKMIIKN